LLVTVNHRLIPEIEIVHDVSCHPIITDFTLQCRVLHCDTAMHVDMAEDEWWQAT